MHAYLHKRTSNPRKKSSISRGALHHITACCYLGLVALLVASSRIFLTSHETIMVERPSTSTTFARPFDPSCIQEWKQRREEAQIVPELDILCQDPTVAYLQVADPPPRHNHTNHQKRPKILCVILTQASNHATRLETILQTWGYQCDRFVGASDLDDPSRYAYRIEGAADGYWGIYSKLMHTLRRIVQEKIPFDWIFKADDDTYVVMENLHAFLASRGPADRKDEPIIYGRKMPWPRLAELKTFGWFTTSEEMLFMDRFYRKFPSTEQRLIYVHGGPGYIMNRAYVDATIHAYFESPDAVKGLISEDMAQSFNMLYRDIRPRSTLDVVTGRERSHPESPRSMYENPHWLPVVQANIQRTGDGDACCSPTSISFHHMTPRDMRILDYQLFVCPKNPKNESTQK